MASQSETDHRIREHELRRDLTPELQRKHDELESKPFDEHAHAGHKRKVAEDRATRREDAAHAEGMK
jgi:hypothetical protein